MKHTIFFLLLISLTMAQYGSSRMTIERIWTIYGSEGSSMEFEGALAINDTNQRVLAVMVEPGMTYESESDGTIKVRYNGTMPDSVMELTAKAVVDVNYDTALFRDVAVPRDSDLGFTNLTEPDDAIRSQALALVDENSSLQTINNLVSWVHNNVAYDLHYWGRVDSARETFAVRRGVCVEYTHLLISMTRSLGFDTRHVSGYVLSDKWQPHAWAEIYVPGYGWLPADATFGQVGNLDSTHLAIMRGEDQASIFDVVTTQNGGTPNLEARDNVSINFISEDPEGVGVAIDFDNETYVVDVAISNSRPDYVYGSYEFLPAANYGGNEYSLLLLKPHETFHRYYGLNRSHFAEGYSYTFPVTAAFNDAKDVENLNIVVEAAESGETRRPLAEPPCLVALLLFLPLLSTRRL